MTTYFISDLHLHFSRPKTTQRFYKFLLNEAKEASALYILGDFFEVWVGDDINDPHDLEVMQALADYVNTGVPVFFMHGNRDFLLGKRFAEKTGCQLIPDPYCVEFYHEKIVLAHGDALCTLDVKYQRFRKFVRQSFIQNLFLKLPLIWRKKIAQNIRTQSIEEKKKNEHNVQSKIFYDVTPDALFKLLREQKATTLIHGHTHKPGIHHFILDNNPAKRINLGEWTEDNITVAKLTPEKLSLVALD